MVMPWRSIVAGQYKDLKLVRNQMKIEKIRSKIFYTLLMLIIPMGLCAQQVWIEKDGYVSFESESTDSPLQKWGRITPAIGIYVADASDSVHLEFTGNNPASGPPSAPLSYWFKIENAGQYRLLIRARQRLEGVSSDRCNDCYVCK